MRHLGEDARPLGCQAASGSCYPGWAFACSSRLGPCVDAVRPHGTVPASGSTQPRRYKHSHSTAPGPLSLDKPKSGIFPCQAITEQQTKYVVTDHRRRCRRPAVHSRSCFHAQTATRFRAANRATKTVPSWPGSDLGEARPTPERTVGAQGSRRPASTSPLTDTEARRPA